MGLGINVAIANGGERLQATDAYLSTNIAGLWVCIGVVEEAVDGIFEILEGAEHAALKALFGEFREEALDGVEPGG